MLTLQIFLNIDEQILAYRRVESPTSMRRVSLPALVGATTLAVELYLIDSNGDAVDPSNFTESDPRFVLGHPGLEPPFVTVGPDDFTFIEVDSVPVGWSFELPLTSSALAAYLSDFVSKQTNFEFNLTDEDDNLDVIYRAPVTVLPATFDPSVTYPTYADLLAAVSAGAASAAAALASQTAAAASAAAALASQSGAAASAAASASSADDADAAAAAALASANAAAASVTAAAASATAADTARAAAVTAQTAAEAARDAASGSASAASTSASAAATSATAAAASASAASTSANSAGTSATAAAASATAAATSATNAATSETNAATSATAAAASATAAAASAAAAALTAAGQFLGGVAGASVPATAAAAGNYYRITSVGTSQSKTWAVGDMALYNGTSGSWTQLAGILPAASTSAAGAVQLPSTSEKTAGTYPAGGATNRTPTVADVRSIDALTVSQAGFAESLLARANPPLYPEPLSAVYSTAAALTLATTYAYDSALVTYTGPTYTFSGSALNWTGNNATGARSLQTWAWSFLTSSADVEMLFRPNSTSPIIYWLWVDGRPVTPSIVTHAYASSNVVKLKLAFGYAKPRRITLWSYGLSFGGAAVNSTYNIQPSPIPRKKVMFLSDSWGAGAGTAVFPAQIPWLMGQAFGWEMAINSIGGTGYVTGTYPFNDANRLAALYAWAPDYIIIMGSINDNPSAASVQAAATALYAAIYTALPATKIIVVGPQPVGPASYRTSATLLANRDAVKAAAAAATSNVLGFIDPIAGQWVTGSGYITSPQGDGNADYFIGTDQQHPTFAGAHWFAARLIDRVEAVFRNAGLDIWGSADPSSTPALTP